MKNAKSTLCLNRSGIGRLAVSLLTGVSTVALAVAETVKAQDFEPWASGFGATDFEHAGAGAEIWIPFAQDADSVTFGFAGGQALVDGDGFGDIGVGHRWLTNPDLGFGVNVSIGYGGSENGANALRGVVGGEVFSGDWDAHLNFQYASGDESPSSDEFILGPGEIFVEGNDIWMETGLSGFTLENAMSGFDGEVGYHVYQFDADSSIDLDLRLAVGGYYFFAADADLRIGPSGDVLPPGSYDDVYGGTLGAELRYYGLGGLPSGAYLFADAQGQYDNQDDWGGNLRVGLSIPLGGVEGPPVTPIRERLRDPLDRRAMQFNERTVDPRVIEEEVYSPFSSTRELIDTVWFADTQGTMADSGAEGDPTTLDDAVERSQAAADIGDGDIIVVQDSDSSSGPGGGDIGSPPPTTGITTNGVLLTNNQILLNANSTIELAGATTGNRGLYTPSDDPLVVSTNPRATISGAKITTNTLIRTDDDVEIIGVGLTFAKVGISADGVFNNQFQDIEITDMFDVLLDSDAVTGNPTFPLDPVDGASANGADGVDSGEDGADGGIAGDGSDGSTGATGGAGRNVTDRAIAAGIRIVNSNQIFIEDVTVANVFAGSDERDATSGAGLGGMNAGNGGDANGGNGASGMTGQAGGSGQDAGDGGDGGTGGNGGSGSDGGDAGLSGSGLSIAGAYGVQVLDSTNIEITNLSVDNLSADAFVRGGGGGIGARGTPGGNGGNANGGNAGAFGGDGGDFVEGNAGGGGDGGSGGIGGQAGVGGNGGAGGDAGAGGLATAMAIAAGLSVDGSSHVEVNGLTVTNMRAVASSLSRTGGFGGAGSVGGNGGNANGGDGGNGGNGGDAFVFGSGGNGGNGGIGGSGGDGGDGGNGGDGGDAGNGGEAVATGIAAGVVIANGGNTVTINDVFVSGASASAESSSAEGATGGNGGVGGPGGDALGGNGGNGGNGGAGADPALVETDLAEAAAGGDGGAAGPGGDGGNGGDGGDGGLAGDGGNGGASNATALAGGVVALEGASDITVSNGRFFDFAAGATAFSGAAGVGGQGGLGGQGGVANGGNPGTLGAPGDGGSPGSPAIGGAGGVDGSDGADRGEGDVGNDGFATADATAKGIIDESGSAIIDGGGNGGIGGTSFGIPSGGGVPGGPGGLAEMFGEGGDEPPPP